MISNNNRMNDETYHQIRQRKVRYVKDAWHAVQQWRDLFENGYYEINGNIVYPNCNQAALKVGIPLRTLQMYHKTFKNISKSIQIDRFLNQKMGRLYKFIQQHKKQFAKEQKQEKEVEQEQEQVAWDNMIIEADDQFSVKIEQDDQHKHQQNYK